MRPPTATVFSSARLVVGMVVTATGISAATTIADINGVTITLSQPASAGSTGTVTGARFSVLGDAQMLGTIGGDAFSGLANKNLPVALPGGSVTVDYPAHTCTTHENLAAASLTTASGSATIPNLQQGLANAQTAPPEREGLQFRHHEPWGWAVVLEPPADPARHLLHEALTPMPSFMNTVGAVSRQGQWRFRHVFRGADESGRLDTSDAGLIDFSTCSNVALTVTARPPHRGGCEPGPIMTASLVAGSLVVSNPGIVEAVFPSGSLLDVPPGLYDARVFVTIGPETEEVFCEPVEFA